MKKSIKDGAALFSNKIIKDFNIEEHCNNKGLLDEFQGALINMYLACHLHLDSKFLKDLLSKDKNQTISCLWEIIILYSLLQNKELIFYPHMDTGPDWRIRAGNKEYYIEAVCAHLPQSKNSEILRVMDEMKKNGKSTSDELLRQEVKSRISNSIYGKIKIHKNFIDSQKSGYILCLSYGAMPFYGTCDVWMAISTLFPLGPIVLDIDTETRNLGNPRFLSKLHI